MKLDESFVPGDVTFFGARRILISPDDLSQSVSIFGSEGISALINFRKCSYWNDIESFTQFILGKSRVFLAIKEFN